MKLTAFVLSLLMQFNIAGLPKEEGYGRGMVLTNDGWAFIYHNNDKSKLIGFIPDSEKGYRIFDSKLGVEMRRHVPDPLITWDFLDASSNHNYKIKRK